jgi:hypothetical protein
MFKDLSGTVIVEHKNQDCSRVIHSTSHLSHLLPIEVPIGAQPNDRILDGLTYFCGVDLA